MKGSINNTNIRWPELMEQRYLLSSSPRTEARYPSRGLVSSSSSMLDKTTRIVSPKIGGVFAIILVQWYLTEIYRV